MLANERTNRRENGVDGMTVVFACDDRYAPLAAIGAVSVLRHNRGARIALLGCNLPAKSCDIVRSRVESNGGVFLYCDASEQIDRLARAGVSRYVSYAVYSRLFIPELLPEDGRVLYLDCDTLVDGSLEDLFGLDMHGRPLALSGDCIPRAYAKFVGIPDNRPYFNSGVMLMDLARWRACGCTEHLLNELSASTRPNPLGDQDVIGRCLSDLTEPLPPKWNFLSQYFLVSYKGLCRIVGGADRIAFTEADYVEARRHAVVYHFSGNTIGRPWFAYSRHPLRPKFLAVVHEAGLDEVANRSGVLPIAYRLQNLLSRILPQNLFDWCCFFLYRLHVYRTYHV